MKTFERMAPESSLVHEVLKWGEAVLGDAGHQDPALETQALLCGLCHWTPTQLHLERQETLSAESMGLFIKQVWRRSRFEPVAYIQGKKNFYGRDFSVNSRVLIPRPETEILVEKVLAEAAKRENFEPRILDIGTGSGCISVTLAKELLKAEVLAIDISQPALMVAAGNARRHQVGNRVQVLQSDLYANLGQEKLGYFDIIVSNPPYVADEEMGRLETDLRNEPRGALCGGADGCAALSPLIQEAGKYLKKNGILALEIGAKQRTKVERIMREWGFRDIGTTQDYQGHDRVVIGQKNGSI